MNGLTEKLASLPSRPGVYLMRETGGKVIYVDSMDNAFKVIEKHKQQAAAKAAVS